MKLFAIVVLLLLMCSISSAGDWEQVAGQHNNTEQVQELLVWNDELYGGTSKTDGGALLKYNSSHSKWDLAAPPLNGQTYIYDLIIYDNKIYASTRHVTDSLGGRLFMFDEPNSTWVEKAGNLNSQDAVVNLHEFNGSLWAGTAHGSRLFKWNGVDAWIQMSGQYGSEIEMYRLFDYNNTLYASTASLGLLLKWNESASTWSQQCPQLNGQDHVGMGVWRGDTWYAGTLSTARLFNWKEGNSTWTEVAPQLGSETLIYTVIMLDGDIYGGTYGSGKLLKWDNISAWESVASQYESEIFIPDLVVWNNEIYGGTNPNGNLLKYIPEYTPDIGDYVYSKKKSVPVYNANATYILTNYSIPINVTWETGMDSDFSDIIVKNNNTGVWLSGCIDRKVDGSWANFWFKADNVSSGWNNATFYLHFGSTSPKPHVCSSGHTFTEHNTFEVGMEGFDGGYLSTDYSYGGVNSFVPPIDNIQAAKTTSTGETEPQIVEYEYYLPSGTTGQIFYGYHGFDSAAKAITSGVGAVNSMEWSYYQTYPSSAWVHTGVFPPTGVWNTMSYIHYPNSTYGMMHNGTIIGAGFYRNEVQDTKIVLTRRADKYPYIDNIKTRKWNTDPPLVGALGPTVGGSLHIPPNPTSVANTTGVFWVNHTWSAGVGNVTDSYNVLVNSVWHNASPAYYNYTYSEYAWQNTTVYAWNASNIGTISVGNISQDTQVANATVIEYTLFANQYGLIRKNGTADQTASAIAATINNDTGYTWFSDYWQGYRVGLSYNAATIIPKHQSYFVFVTSDTNVTCKFASAESVAVPFGYYLTYLREDTNKTLAAIKTDMGANVTSLYAWTGTAWTSSGTYYVEPNEGIFVDSSAAFVWDGSVS